MGPFRIAVVAGALLLAGLTPVIAQTESCTVPARQIPENPSFEAGSLSPWQATKACSAGCPGAPPEIIEDAENAHDGSWVFRQSFDDNILWHLTQPITIDSPGEPHNISFWYRYEALPGITVDYCNIAVRYGTTPIQNIYVTNGPPDAGWTQLSATWTPTTIEYTLYVTYGCNYTTFYLDDVQFWAPERETTCSTTTSTTSTLTSTTVTSSSTSTPITPPTTSSSTTSDTTTSSTTTSSTTSTTTTSSTTSYSTSTFTTTTKPTCNPHRTKTITKTKTVTVTTCPTSLPRYFECLVDGIHHH
ncbi:uncharacterized protein BDW70DRAFT_159189 [Aspergillus foveolatus]|uniref:uncharacterized protein n=1 Tax=Aspergillus foveolatus TaxID=210207 RepID=UPI003CCE4D08